MRNFYTLFLWSLSCNFCLALSSSSSSSSPSRTSIVTGANGYVAREIAASLAANDERVYCLVRGHRVASEKEYWEKKSEKVTVLPYDMLDGGASLRSALERADNCDQLCVYHVASSFGPTDDHEKTALGNVRCTEDLVNVVAEFENCRLVLTSSTAAVRGSGQTPGNGKYYTHEDWNELSKLGENWGASYQWSKKESEKRAWEIAKERGVNMASICPSFVFGPPTDGKMSGSYALTLVQQWVEGRSPVQSRLCVDVRDVAKAHIMAGTLDRAIGERFIVSKEARVPSQEMAETLQRICRETGMGNPDAITFDGDFAGGAVKIGEQEVEAEARLKDILGVELRSVDETMADMGRVLLGGIQSTST